MPVVDEIYVRDAAGKIEIDSLDNQMIDEVMLDGVSCHFAKEAIREGEDSVVCDNAVDEPFRCIETTGNSHQKIYEGNNPFLFRDFTGSKTDSDGNVLSWEMKDGIMTINGKSNVFTTVTINEAHTVHRPTFKAGTYTLTPFYYKENVSMGGCDWQFRNVKTGERVWSFTGNNGLATKTFNYDIRFIAASLYIYENREYKDFKWAPAILEGSYATLDDLPAYEPYVHNPQEIENTNDEGMSVVVHGDNLFNQEDLLTDSNFTKAEYNGFECIKVRPTKVNHIFTFPKPIPAGSTLYLRFDLAYPNAIDSYFVLRFDDNTTTNIYGATNANKVSEFRTQSRTLKLSKNVVSIDFRFYQIGARTPYYIKNFMVNIGSDYIPYQPYFREEVGIPASIKVNGATVPLRFGKQGSKSDKLIVDGLNKKVTYERWVGYVNLPPNSSTWNVTTTANQVKTIRASINFGSYFGNMDYSQRVLCNRFAEVFDATIDEPSFYHPSSVWIALRINRDLLETQDVAGVKKWLQTQQDEGNPVSIHYAYNNAKTYDITTTDLGQQLLALAARNGTNYIEITGASSLGVNYWRQVIPNEET